MPTTKCEKEIFVLLNHYKERFDSFYIAIIEKFCKYIIEKYKNKNNIFYSPTLENNNCYESSEAYNIPIDILTYGINRDINISINSLLYIYRNKKYKYKKLNKKEIDVLLLHHKSSDYSRFSSKNEIFVTDYVDEKCNFIPIVVDGNKRLNYAKENNIIDLYSYIYFPIFHLPIYTYLDLDSFIFSFTFYNLLYYCNCYCKMSFFKKLKQFFKLFFYTISCRKILNNRKTIILPFTEKR